MDCLPQILADLSNALDQHVRLQSSHPVGGGSINNALHLETSAGPFFVKLNRGDARQMFEAEAEGLRELAGASAVRVPRPIASGCAAGRCWLVLEHLNLRGQGEPARFGQALAELHRHTAGLFGWTRDNTIGSTPQCNAPDEDWIAFWRECRLGAQLRLAAQDGAPRTLLANGERLLEALPALFDGYRPEPSLLHGDLWSGNWGYTQDGKPVIFDPAVYYGDREADIAMTELFGSPGDTFYAAYDAAWARDPGYRVRRTLYNLYHILNHHHLFGGGYAAQATRMTAALLAQLRG